MVVADKVAFVGSRCVAPFRPPCVSLKQRLVDVEPLTHDSLSLEDGVAAFERAAAPGILKGLLILEARCIANWICSVPAFVV